MRVVVSVLLLLGLISACAETPGGAGPDEPVASSSPAGDVAGGGSQLTDDTLQITIDPGDGAPEQRYTLTCSGGIEGSLPDPAAACQYLESLDEPFAPVPEDAVCTEQYGGPQTARIIGSWNGEPVDLELSRINGCFISQWEQLAPLLPVEVGVEDLPQSPPS